MRSSSTQPPDTEPTTCPSSRTATMAPIGRGAEPQVFTMVPSATLRPLRRHSSAVRRTSISTLSMRKCYLNSAATQGTIRDGDVRGVTGGDLAHDGEAEAAAGTRSPGHAVEPLEDAAALGGRYAGTIVLHLEKCMPVAPAGAHSDAAPARGIFERVVHQIRKRFTQQERIAVHRRRLELKAQIDIACKRLAHPRFGFAARDVLEVYRRHDGTRTRLGARQREQLIGEARCADRRLVDLLELRAAGLRHRLRERQLGMRLQAGERRAQLVRSFGDEA